MVKQSKHQNVVEQVIQKNRIQNICSFCHGTSTATVSLYCNYLVYTVHCNAPTTIKLSWMKMAFAVCHGTSLIYSSIVFVMC